MTRNIGPIASTSYRLAARIANGLKAGFAVRSMDELSDCRIVLLCAPGGTLGRVASGLSETELRWQGKILLLCDSSAYSCDIPSFHQRGAAVGSVNPIDGLADRYIIEGDREAVREARQFVRELGKSIEVPTSRIRIYDAAVTLSGSLFTPLIETCVECVRQAGIAGPAAASMAESLLQRSIRTFMHAGRKSWSGPVARADRAAIEREYHALSAKKPLMGTYFRNSADFAFELYQTFPELTRYNHARWIARERE